MSRLAKHKWCRPSTNGKWVKAYSALFWRLFDGLPQEDRRNIIRNTLCAEAESLREKAKKQADKHTL